MNKIPGSQIEYEHEERYFCNCTGEPRLMVWVSTTWEGKNPKIVVTYMCNHCLGGLSVSGEFNITPGCCVDINKKGK